MKVFVTDKYRLLTFSLICLSIVLCGIFPPPTSSPVSVTSRKDIPIYSVKRDDNAISVTFDCAWGDGDIDKIIAVLDKHKCKATFFVLGTWAKSHPESLKKLHNSGHEIGNHSYNHTYYTKLNSEEMLADMEKCDNEISGIIDIKPTLFRAPSGDYNDNVVFTCEESGRKYIQWSVDSLDWRNLTGEQMLERIIPKTQSGDILLFHNDTAHTAESLDTILTALEEKGFKFLKVSDLIYKDHYTIDHTGKQIKN
ncbi:MAG: polysaccharide deacetylase family protein [Clostridia bacterium]|nr:polysaccharide deacetylase family protein [Clostridia bacterium]